MVETGTTGTMAEVEALSAPPRVGGGHDESAWVGGSNLTNERSTRPTSTLARRPTDFKSASEIERRAVQGLPEDRRLSLDEKTSKITLTSWVNAMRSYLEERGMDTVFRIFDPDNNSETYILKDYGSASSTEVTTWTKTLEKGVGDRDPCNYDLDNLMWSGKAIMNSIALDLWETIEKDIGVQAGGPVAYATVVGKIQQVSASSVRSLVSKLKVMSLIKEPGQNVETFGTKIIEMTRRITGSGSSPVDLTSIVASTFLECDVLSFKIKALSIHDLVDEKPTAMEWEEIVRVLKAKYTSLEGQDLWTPTSNTKPAESVLDGLHAAINKLAAQVDGGPNGQGSMQCWTCNQYGHSKADCPQNRSNGSSGAAAGSRRVAPAEGAPATKVVNGVSFSWCSRCRYWTKGAKEHTTATHVRRSPGATETAAAPVSVPAPVTTSIAGVAAAATSTSDRYDGGRLRINGALLFGGAKGINKEPVPVSDPCVSMSDPTICTDDLFFSDAFRIMQDDEDEFHDAVDDHTKMQPETAKTLGEANKSSHLKPSGFVASSDSGAHDDTGSLAFSDGGRHQAQPNIGREPPPGRCPNCRNYGWLANLCDTCEDTGFTYEEVESSSAADTEEFPDDGSVDDSPAPVEVDWSLGRCVSCGKEGTVLTACVDCSQPVHEYDFWHGKCAGCGQRGMHGTSCNNCKELGLTFDGPPSSDDASRASSDDDETGSRASSDEDDDDDADSRASSDEDSDEDGSALN
jgi:hypothetical protein